MTIFYLFLAVVAIIVIAAVFFVSKKNRRKQLAQALNLKLLLVRLPQKHLKDSPESGSAWKEEINFSAQFFSALAGIKSPIALEAAVPHIGQEIHFYIAAPQESLLFVKRQVEGLFKDAHIEEVDDYNIFNPTGINSGVYLKQKLSFVLPLRTYIEAEADTFAPILSGFSSINEIGEGVAMQVLVKPAPDSAKKEILQVINNLKKGNKLDEALKGVGIGLKDIQEALEKIKTEMKILPKLPEVRKAELGDFAGLYGALVMTGRM